MSNARRVEAHRLVGCRELEHVFSLPTGYDTDTLGDLVTRIPPCPDCANPDVVVHARNDWQVDVYRRHELTCPARRQDADTTSGPVEETAHGREQKGTPR